MTITVEVLTRIKNTILVLTADHSHWPEREYIKVAGNGFNRMTFEDIGLFIYSPFHKLPRRFDAKNATSIGFAPMVTQLLGMEPETNNSFIGYSPFDLFSGNEGLYLCSSS